MSAPDKCPKCGAAALISRIEPWPLRFDCQSYTPVPTDAKMLQESARCVYRQRDQLAARVKRLEEAVGIALKMREEWVQNEDECYAGAYYAFVKGCDDDWGRILQAKEAQP